MNYKKLGNTDIKVSTICLGTMTWGEQNTQEEGFEQMDFALDQGVNFGIQLNYMLCHQRKKLLVIQK
jgi:aryl-alcohol dehydrogenase-like predicted oxidoreductase